MFQDIPPVPMDIDFGNGMAFSGDAAKALMIDQNDLMKEATSHTGLIVFWGCMAAEASFAATMQKQTVKTVRGSRWDDIKQAMTDAGVKVTDTAINSRVDTDDRVISAEAALARAVMIEAQTKAMYEAVKNRKDLILVVNRLITASGETDPVEMNPPSPSVTPVRSARRRSER